MVRRFVLVCGWLALAARGDSDSSDDDGAREAYQAACGKHADGSLHCWGGGVGNLAAPLLMMGNAIEPVDLHTACANNPITEALHYLSTGSVLRRATTVIPITCP